MTATVTTRTRQCMHEASDIARCGGGWLLGTLASACGQVGSLREAELLHESIIQDARARVRGCRCAVVRVVIV